MRDPFVPLRAAIDQAIDIAESFRSVDPEGVFPSITMSLRAWREVRAALDTPAAHPVPHSTSSAGAKSL